MHRTKLASWLLCVSFVAGSATAGCSAVIHPDTNRLSPDGGQALDATGALDVGLQPDAYVPPGTDTGVPPGDDAWVAGNDAWVPPGTDAWVGSPDAWAPRDAWVAPDTGPMCVPGVECAGYSDALSRAPRDAAGATAAIALTNCVIQLHQSDCCGARHAYGINHAARSTLCSAETACDAMYPPATCVDARITTDAGETTSNPNEVRIRAVRPTSCAFGTCWTCETFVCRSATCASAPGISGGCGP